MGARCSSPEGVLLGGVFLTWSNSKIEIQKLFIIIQKSVRLTKKFYVSKLLQAFVFSVRVYFSKIQDFNFLCLKHCFFGFFFHCFMKFLVKIYMKRYERHNTTLWITDFFNSVLCLVSCSSKNQVPYLILNLGCDQLKFGMSAQEKKNAFRSALPICHKL